ncbi:MAG: S8 family serine peptidase [Bacteroidota bacterium]
MLNSNTLQNISTLILFFCFSFSLNAQVIWEENFDASAGLPAGWNISANNGGINWTVANKATIEQNNGWGTRKAPESISGNQAALLGADQNNFFVNQNSELISPSINLGSFNNLNELHLRFYQSYRSYESSTSVELSVNNGPFQEIYNNDHVANNVETGSKDLVIIPLNGLPASPQNVKIKFVFSGESFFWSIDDVTLVNGNPNPPTYPAYLGDFLFEQDYAYEVSPQQGAFVKQQVIVYYKPEASLSERQFLRDSLGVANFQLCTSCDGLVELWTFGNFPNQGDEPSDQGPTLDLNERVKGAKSKSLVDAVDYNFYSYDRLNDKINSNNSPLQLCITTENPEESFKIVAILDTGVDYDHNDLVDYIWKNDDALSNGDEDDNCYEDDCIGWNFVDDNNNPDDNHGGGHGTHVAGIVVNNYTSTSSCDFRIMPLKTHDSRGVGQLMDVICASIYAINNGADVLNMSFGYYGEWPVILEKVLTLDPVAPKADFVVVAASGNDDTPLDTIPQYPACLNSLNNLVAVGSMDASNARSIFSNYSWVLVDLLAPGENISSTVPNNLSDTKSGTSMAAPYVSASIGMAYCGGATDFTSAISTVTNCASANPSAPPSASSGQQLYEVDGICLSVPQPVPPTPQPLMLLLLVASVVVVGYLLWRFFFRKNSGGGLGGGPGRSVNNEKKSDSMRSVS